MQVAPWTIAAYIGVGTIWLVTMLVLARRQYEWVSLKEAVIHLLAWPFVFVALRLWSLALVAAAIVGLAAISASAPDTLIAEFWGAVRRVSTQ